MAGRPRKLLKNSSGNMTVAVKKQKMAEEAAVSGRSRSVLEEMPSELRDRYAKETWERIMPDMLEDSTTCNLDRDNIICYCNAWSQYLEATRKLKRNKKDDKYQDMWIRRQALAAAEQRRYGKLCGMDASSRLKNATAAVEDNRKAIDMMYGAI